MIFFRCNCIEGYFGNPFVECQRPECRSNDECPQNLACQNQKCINPCSCGNDAQCFMKNHIPTCQCPPGYLGSNERIFVKIVVWFKKINYFIIDPAISCTPMQYKDECNSDVDCSSNLACFDKKCANPCDELKPCGKNANCFVENTLPLRTMVWF